MTAEIISVGTELLLGQITDTHAPVMSRLLAECGISCTRRVTVGDNTERLLGALKSALEHSDVVVTIGGLGPTLDDITRDCIAEALGDKLELVPEVEANLREFFASRNVPWVDSTARQAYKPTCATLINNPNGTAPGLLCKKNNKVVIALPGPKGEFDPMAYGPVKEFLATLSDSGTIHSRTLRIVGMGETQVEELVKHLMDSANPTVAPYAHVGEVHLRLTAKADNLPKADHMIDPIDQEIRSLLGDAVYGVDNTSLEEAVINLLIQRHTTVSLAESMTGGLLAERLTNVPGSSQAFAGGVVAYRPHAKQALLGVPGELLDSHGPVSDNVARSMAQGIKMRLGTAYGVSITGNAGPTTDGDKKAVGTVFIAISGPERLVCEEAHYRGTREDIRRRATQTALMLLRREVLASD